MKGMKFILSLWAQLVVCHFNILFSKFLWLGVDIYAKCIHGSFKLRLLLKNVIKSKALMFLGPGSEYFVVFIHGSLFSYPFSLRILHIRISETNFFPISSLATWIYCRAREKECKILMKQFQLASQSAANQRIRKKTPLTNWWEGLKFLTSSQIIFNFLFFHCV